MNDVFLTPQAFANPADVKLTTQGGGAPPASVPVIQLRTLQSMTGD